MYISISAQSLGGHFSQSVSDFVDYLEKENQGMELEAQEPFFNQYGETYSTQEIIKDIDSNTAKLKKDEPKFYSITVNPSKRELKQLQNSSKNLKRYTRELMKDYVTAFNREIYGNPVTINDIKYYAKIEHTRHFKGTDYLNVYRTNGNKKRKASFQNLPQKVIYKHKMPNTIINGKSQRFVYVLPKFVLGDNEKLMIELKELKRGRRVILETNL